MQFVKDGDAMHNVYTKTRKVSDADSADKEAGSP